MKTTFDKLDQVIEYVLNTLKENPERDIYTARQAVLKGENRPFPVLSINHLQDATGDLEPTNELELPSVNIQNKEDNGLGHELMSCLEPLKLMNPINLSLGLGKGPGTLITCFGIPLDPECDHTPAYTMTIDEVLATPIPDIKKCGLGPEMFKRIELLKDKLPKAIKIRLCDCQGPFNIAHSLVGDEVMLTPYLEPEKFNEFMTYITDFWLAAVSQLMAAIGKEQINDSITRIAECSVNLISREMYEEFILPCDLRIHKELGPVGIHTCSGPHVFYGTLENIPNIVYTEAGMISKTAAGYTDVFEAMKAIKNKPILLNIGQELWEDDHFETIKQHLDLYKDHNRLLFNYTAMNLGKKDRPYIRELHQRLDEYWHNEIYEA